MEACQQLDDSINPIGEALDEAADLTIRHLAYRAGLSVSAMLVLNSVDRGGPAGVSALAAAHGVG